MASIKYAAVYVPLAVALLALAAADVRSLYNKKHGRESSHSLQPHQSGARPVSGRLDFTDSAPDFSSAPLSSSGSGLSSVGSHPPSVGQFQPRQVAGAQILGSPSGISRQQEGHPSRGNENAASHGSGIPQVFLGPPQELPQFDQRSLEEAQSLARQNRFVGPASQTSGSSSLQPIVQQRDGGLMFSSSGTQAEQPLPEFSSGTSGIDALASADARILNQPSSNADAVFITGSGSLPSPAQITVTTELTVDHFVTLTNLVYHSVPVTLTEFLKVTRTAPTFQAVTTPVDDVVLVSRVPASRTDTVTVTDTNSGYQYATEVSTVLYTVTHKNYDIRQQTITSLVVQTQEVRPRIVSTRIDTEYDTQTVTQTISHTVVVDPFVPRAGPLPQGLYRTPHRAN